MPICARCGAREVITRYYDRAAEVGDALAELSGELEAAWGVRLACGPA